MLQRIIVANLLFILSTGCAVKQSSSFEFALVGDNPYTAETFPIYERLIDDVNRQKQIEWVMHVGDVKGGIASCSDEELQRYFHLNQRFDKPFFVTPGDNDWLDCKRPDAGGFNEYERLRKFREIFYTEENSNVANSLQQLQRQPDVHPDHSDFIENAMWTRQDVVFATVHVVALTEPATDLAEWEKRVAAATAWIKQAFSNAHETNAKGVFLAMQADPWIFFGLPLLADQSCSNCVPPRDSLSWLYPLLAEESIAFERPVVLAVGDTHIFRVDKPLYSDKGALVQNFTRVESFGHPLVNWVNVLVEPDSPWVFSFREQLVD